VGTLLASQQAKKAAVYVVVRGDTLWDIAQRHRVSTKEIQRRNKLKSTSIHVGQRIIIPSRS